MFTTLVSTPPSGIPGVGSPSPGSPLADLTLVLTESEHSALRAVGDALRERWPLIVEDFYRFLVEDPASKFLVKAHGGPERLHGLQVEYFQALTAGEYGSAFVQKRIRVGDIHAAVGVKPETYQSAYAWYLDRLLLELSLARAMTPEAYAAGVRALSKVVLFDVRVVLVAYHNRDRRALLRLKESAEALADSVPDAVLTTDSAGRIVDLNQSSERILAADRCELVGMPVAEFLHEFHRGLFIDGPGRLGSPAPPAPGPSFVTALRADGSAFPAEFTFRYASADGNDGVVVLRDLSDCSYAAPALRGAAANFQALVANSPDIVLVHRGDRILYANTSAARRLEAASPVLLHGRRLSDFFDRLHRCDTGPLSAHDVTFVLTLTREMPHWDGIQYEMIFDAAPATALVLRPG